MPLFLFVLIPITWAITGKLLGVALSAAFFFRVNGKRRGRRLGFWAAIMLPTCYLTIVWLGLGGNAGSGMTLFGSQPLLDLACNIPLFAIVVLGLFAGGIYVVRDLTTGHAQV